jgi:hypothetical protein
LQACLSDVREAHRFLQFAQRTDHRTRVEKGHTLEHAQPYRQLDIKDVSADSIEMGQDFMGLASPVQFVCDGHQLIR